MYVNSIATLTPAGELTVTLGDVAENGPRWNQFISILPFVGFLPVAAIVLRLGKRQVKVSKDVVRKFELLTEPESKSILVAVSKAKTDDEAGTIMRREVDRIIGNRQIHHPISKPVHDALEIHRVLKGKYKYRDPRFESLAKDLRSHVGRQDWHRAVDKQTADWLRNNRDATEEKFEEWLRWRYSEPDLKARFPKVF